MAKDPDSPEIRFPLRRSEVAPEPPPAPTPEKPKRVAIPWRPRAIDPTPQKQWYENDEGFAPLELTNVAPPPPRRENFGGWPPPPPQPPYQMPPEAMPPGSYTTNLPVAYKPSLWRWVPRIAGGLIVLFIVAVGWLALTAPLSKSLLPPAPPSITLLASDGTPIARRGAVIGKPVDVTKLPKHVSNAFVAIEDKRFYSHWGVDPRGILRAFVHNATGAAGPSQGGSTITQQLAKNAFLDSSRTASRKLQEVMIAFWLEGWLSKQEILSRYLSNVYFGDNVYGLSAASRHYFDCNPEDLTESQATMLAGLVQAPSRLAPTGNLKGARARQKLVIAAMASGGFLSKAEAAEIRPAVLRLDKTEKPLPNGGYFADWVLPQARDRAGGVATEQRVYTTLGMRAQKAAERAVRNAGLKKAQIAIVAMRPNGEIIAMVGGTNYAASPFNRATMARRQPGSAFKLFVYLAALRGGMQPDDIVDDSPVTIGNWSPQNSHGYSGKITLQQAFAKSSNVVAARLTQRFGVSAVTKAARDLGISTPIGNDASIALGTSTVSLLELTSAYASVAKGDYPVRPKGLSDLDQSDSLGGLLGGPTSYGNGQLEDLRKMMTAVVQSGTGRSAALSIPSYGKTGTTQDNRDALFVGVAGEGENAVVAGVWLGNDDNSPNAALSGGGLPARIWRDFMINALGIQAPPPVVDEPIENETDNGSVDLPAILKGIGITIDNGTTETQIDTRDPGEKIPPPPGAPRRDDAVVTTRVVPEDRRVPSPQPTRKPKPSDDSE